MEKRTGLSIVLILYFLGIRGIRVCNKFAEYFDIVNNKGCYNSPYTKWTQREIISSWGFNAEEYFAETEDGYIINIVRGYGIITKSSPVLLGHGFLNNAYSWLGKANASLVYLLGQFGFDVWIVNWRGTKQSRKHKTLSDKQKEYWQFSIDEMGKYDLPAVLRKIREITNKEKTIYIGYSMGCNIGYSFAIEYPEQAKEQLKRLILIAPAIYLINIRSIATLVVPFIPILKEIPFLNWHSELFPFFAKRLPQYVCGYTPGTLILCEFVKSLIVGFNFEQLDPEKVPIFDAINFDATSFGVGNHLAQLIKSKKFEAYNWGKTENLKKYGTETPTIYNLTEVKLPVTIYAGANDYLVLEKNARKGYNELQPQYQCGFHVVSDKKFTHYSVTEAKDAQHVLYPSILNAVGGGSEVSCK